MDTVTPLPEKEQTTHIGVVGYILGIGALLLLLPLLPLLVALKLLDSLRDDGQSPDL